MQQMFLFVSPASDKHFVINKVYLYDHVDQIPRLHLPITHTSTCFCSDEDAERQD